MVSLSVKDIEYISFKLTKEWFEFNEPIPDFGTRFPNILEICVSIPFQKYNNKSLYQGITGKAAILLYLMIKNHPFQNGNKRIAMTTLMVFLYTNKRWLKVDQQEFYNFCMWIAQSPAKLKDETVKAAEKFIQTSIVPLKE